MKKFVLNSRHPDPWRVWKGGPDGGLRDTNGSLGDRGQSWGKAGGKDLVTSNTESPQWEAGNKAGGKAGGNAGGQDSVTLRPREVSLIINTMVRTPKAKACLGNKVLLYEMSVVN